MPLRASSKTVTAGASRRKKQDEEEAGGTSVESAESVRRSSRKRTTSKWLEDMHTDFSAPVKTKMSENREDDLKMIQVPLKRPSSPRAKSENKKSKTTGAAVSCAKQEVIPPVPEVKELARVAQENENNSSVESVDEYSDVGQEIVCKNAGGSVESSCHPNHAGERQNDQSKIENVADSETVAKDLPEITHNVRRWQVGLEHCCVQDVEVRVENHISQMVEQVEAVPQSDDQSLAEYLLQVPVECLDDKVVFVEESGLSGTAVTEANSINAELEIQSCTPADVTQEAQKASRQTSPMLKDSKRMHVEILNILEPSSKAVAVVEEGEKNCELVAPTYTELTPASQTVVDSLLSDKNVRTVNQHAGEHLSSPSKSGLNILTAAATSKHLAEMSCRPHAHGESSVPGGQVHVPQNMVQETESSQSNPGLAVVESIAVLQSEMDLKPQQKLSVQNSTAQASVMLASSGQQQRVAVCDGENSPQPAVQPPKETNVISEALKEHLFQGDGQDGKDLVMETVTIDDLPEQIASILKNISTSGRQSVSLDGGMKYRVVINELSADHAQPKEKLLQGGAEKSISTVKFPSPWPVGLLKCSHCDYVTDKRANWYKHKNTHGERRPYQCKVCDYSSKTSCNLKRHMTIHTNVRSFSCTHPGCGDKFKQKIHLDRHIRYKHLPKEVQCELCSYTCATRNPDLLTHIKKKHSKKPSESAPKVTFKCHECTFETPSKKDLKQHMKFHSKGPELKLFCEDCSFVTDCQSRLTRHRLVHTKERPYKCGMCDYKASQKEHVIRHMRTKHHQDVRKVKQVVMRPLSDSDEESKSIDSANVKSEPLVLDNSQAVSELVTENQVASLENCAATVEVHENELAKIDNLGVVCKTEPVEYEAENSCDQSEMSNVEHTTLVAALKEAASSAYSVVGSSGSDSEKLTVCPKADSCSQELMQESKNDGEKSKAVKKRYLKMDYSNLPKVFGCDYCTMRFAKLLNLYKHINVQHANIHPAPPPGMFACVICDFQTPQKSALLVHMRRHNPEVDEMQNCQNLVFSCVLCQYCTPKRRNLYWHFKKKHKISLLVNKDGTVKCVVEENGPVRVVPSEGTVSAEGAVDSSGDEVVLAIKDYFSPSKTKFVKVTDLAQSLLQPKLCPPQGEVQVIATDGEGFSDQMMADVISMEGVVVTTDDDAAAVAIEGLQALAEQAIPPMSPQQTEVIVSEVLAEEIEQGNGILKKTIENSFHLSPEEVMQLSSGDYVEIDGEMYKVEFASEDGEDTGAKEVVTSS